MLNKYLLKSYQKDLPNKLKLFQYRLKQLTIYRD